MGAEARIATGTRRCSAALRHEAPPDRGNAARLLLALLLAVLAAGCEPPGPRFASRTQTWGELRAVRGEVTVAAPNDKARPLFPRERLVDGAAIEVPAEGLAWLRRDGGATLLVRGPASLTFRASELEVKQGRLFVDSPGDAMTVLGTRQARLNLVRVRASIEVAANGAATEAYVLAGEIRSERGERAGAGERLLVQGDGAAAKATVEPAVAWVDWTGGLATTDRTAEPAPFGVGTVGARPAGAEGAPRAPLAIQRMDVRVKIDGELAITEVDQLFFNGASDTVEGIYTFRTPEGATLTRFGVDRQGVVVWGRVKERAAAAAQYRSNVYQGSTEDPALLEWDAPGVYRARLYPMGPGEARRVVVRYTEWLSRTGARGERRLYLFPMAAEGAEASLPRIEFFRAVFDLDRAGAREVRVGMQGEQQGQRVTVRAHDLVPRADLALELFGDSVTTASAFRAAHQLDPEMSPPAERTAAAAAARGEADYVLVPLRAADVPRPSGGLDLVIVVDTSAATDPASLGIARAAVGALLAHLGPKDRALVWAGDVALRPVAAGWTTLKAVDDELRRAAAIGLATAERGGATDLGAVLGEAATQLDSTRRGAVVYVGDGRPTVGELALGDLRERLGKLARPVRIFSLGVGQDADLGLLQGVARGGFAERLGDAASAARTALRLLEAAERAAWLGVSVDLGPTVERIYPRDLDALVADETVLLIGRVSGELPRQLELKTPAGNKKIGLVVRRISDQGDLRARWAGGRLRQMLGEGAGRAALVDLGVRSGIITPYTSFYVPTANEMTSDERLELDRKKRQLRTDLLSENPFERVAASSISLGPVGCAKYEKSQASDEQARADAPKLRVAQTVEPSATGRAEANEGERAANRDEVAATKSPAEPNAPAARPASGSSASGGEPKAGDKDKVAAASEPAATATAVPPPDDGKARGTGAPPAVPAQGDATVAWGRDDSAGRGPSPAASAAPVKGANGWRPESGEAEAKTATGKEAAEFGMIGLLGPSEAGRGDDGVFYEESGDLGGIGTIGAGAGGGGKGTGRGFGAGHGRLGASRGAGPPAVRQGAATVNGALPAEVVQRIVRQNHGRFRLCYQDGLRNNPSLQGKVTVRFVIGRNGAVSAVRGGGDFPDAAVVRCVAASFNALTFPQPEGGLVTVEYPILFSPADAALGLGAERSRLEVRVVIDGLPHWPIPCSGGASLPFEDRVALWRERLSGLGGSPGLVAQQYVRAISSCEAPSWRERSRLLSLMLGALPTVDARVVLWSIMGSWSVEADFLYRAILAGVRTPEEMRQLHAALGLRFMDPAALEKLLSDITEPKERVRKLRALAVQWPDDFSLALRLLDALEDVPDDAGARELARQLRARPDADAHVLTEVGELYLRLAKRAASKEQAAADEAEARRSFGEIVEYAPEEPTARRLLGDLLRAHGWYAEAARQYETLARLSPDDAGVKLLLAATAQGLGKLEEAVGWTEKVSDSGGPSEGADLGRTARAMGATFLGWGRAEALAKGRNDEVALLRTRSERLLAKEDRAPATVRAVLLWSHPALHPTLWSNATGTMMPAAEGDATLGVAQLLLPEREGSALEVRLEPSEVEHAARLGAEAVLTVVFDEAGKEEKVVRRSVSFARGGPARLRFEIGGKEVLP